MVPPGDVTAARNDSGVVVAVGEQRRRAEQGLAHQLLAGVARQADEHAGLDHRLGDEEHVGRARAREPGDRVELRFGHADHDPDRAEDALADLEVERGGVRPAAMAAAPWPTSAPVLGIARTTGRPGAAASSAARVTPAAIDRTRAPSGRTSAQPASASMASAGFTAITSTSASVATHAGLRRDAHPGQARLEHVAAVGVDLGDGQRLGLPAALEQADGEGFAHAAAAEECQVHPGRVSVGRLRTQGIEACRGPSGWARGTLGAAPYFPERDGPPAPRAHTNRSPSGPADTT